MLLCLQNSIEALKPTPSQPVEEECDWFCQIQKEPSTPIKRAEPAKLTPQQIGSQLAQLSNSDRSIALKEAAAQLATPLPTGNQKTGPFFRGLGKALNGVTTLTSNMSQSIDLRDQLPILIPAAQSELLLAAGSF